MKELDLDKVDLEYISFLIEKDMDRHGLGFSKYKTKKVTELINKIESFRR